MDPIPTWLLRDLQPSLIPVLTEIINTSLSSGIVPCVLKHAIVKPLLKKPSLDKALLKNYRPVSNLPFVSKLLERAVATQYVRHCEMNDLQVAFQAAYKKCNSTETAMTRVHNDLMQAVDRDGAALLILLDLSAAFDTIDQKLLLRILQSEMMVSGVALRWFESYLSGRTQAISIKGTLSTKKALTCGVPQGSVLGPILFTTYTSPLARIISDRAMPFMLYADDTQLYLSFRPSTVSDAVDSLTSCVNDIKNWMDTHYLRLNADKTEVLVISSPSVSRSLRLPAFELAGAHVKPSAAVRDLGVTLDSALRLDCHVSNVVRSSYAHLSKIARIRRYLTAEAAKNLVISRLDYCNVILYGISGTLLAKLQRLQNHAARVITGTRKYDHITPVLKSLHWLPVEQRIVFKIMLLTFKSLHGLAPSYLSELLHSYKPSRTLRSNSQNLLVVPNFRLDSFGGRAFSNVSPRLWNNLPQRVRDCATLSAFKRSLKTHLFIQAYGQ